MIRLYLNQSFEVGQCLALPPEELRYYRQVRRSPTEVELFNRSGQVARGRFENDEFVVEEVSQEVRGLHALSVAVALPSAKVIRELIFSLSELGATRLIFFEGARSQAADTHLKRLEKWKRWAVEAARQCGRNPLLELQSSTRAELLKWPTEDERWFLDEQAADRGSPQGTKLSASPHRLIVVGCEGGWTQEERESWQQAGFRQVHLEAPTLRVPTACLVAASLSLWESYFNAAQDSTND